MKKENILVIALICIAFGAVMIHSYINEGGAVEAAPKKTSDSDSKDAGIQWKEYHEGMKQAKSRNIPIFLYFHAEWCTYCKKMEATTFKDAKVSAYLNENFVSISIDTDKDTEISNQWKVRGLPTIWFLKADGTKLDNLPGYVDEEYLTKVLNYIHSGKYETMSFNQFLDTVKRD